MWANVGSCGTPSQKQRTTVITCESAPEGSGGSYSSPGGSQAGEFPRRVTSRIRRGDTKVAVKSRVCRLNRAGTTVVSEEMDLPIAGHSFGQAEDHHGQCGKPPLAIVASRTAVD